MDVFPANLFVPLGAIAAAIAAALIAGFFSFLNLVISKEQKVSEFRQAWIDKLREDVSKYVGSITYLASANAIWISQGRADVLKHYDAMRPSFNEASQAFTSIVLRLNPADSNSATRQKTQDFLSALTDVRNAVRNEKYDDARKLADMLSEKIQPILKYEWERVKKGEFIYRATCGAAIAIVLVGLLAASFFAYRAYDHLPSEVPAPANEPMKPAH